MVKKPLGLRITAITTMVHRQIFIKLSLLFINNAEVNGQLYIYEKNSKSLVTQNLMNEVNGEM